VSNERFFAVGLVMITYEDAEEDNNDRFFDYIYYDYECVL